MNKNFESFPNEIFLHGLFDYFSWEELYEIFYNLNQRFNNILQNLKYLQFTVNATNNQHPALSFFTPCISSLTVCLGQFDIKSFSNLRSLILQYPTRHQRDAIRPENFPCLQFLHLTYPCDDMNLLNLIFSNAFPYLRKCEFGRTYTDHTWNGSPKLRSLSISVNGPYGIICVLRACPNLSRLSIIVYNTSEDILPRHSISCMNSSLRHLFIRSSFKILLSVLKVTPYLKWLTFDDIVKSMYTGDSDFIFNNLARSLSTLNQLSYLHFTIVTSVWNGHTSLHKLHPLFKYVTHGKINSIMIISSSTE